MADQSSMDNMERNLERLTALTQQLPNRKQVPEHGQPQQDETWRPRSYEALQTLIRNWEEWKRRNTN